MWKTLSALGELRALQGRANEARHAYGEAIAVIETVAASLTDEQLRSTFLKSEPNQTIKLRA